MGKAIKTLRTSTAIAALELAGLVTALESYINPAELARENGADCQTQQAIFEYYATIKLAYMTGKRELETLVPGLKVNSDVKDWFIDGLDSVSNCYREERIK